MHTQSYDIEVCEKIKKTRNDNKSKENIKFSTYAIILIESYLQFIVLWAVLLKNEIRSCNFFHN